jgi:hypothetical protein
MALCERWQELQNWLDLIIERVVFLVSGRAVGNIAKYSNSPVQVWRVRLVLFIFVVPNIQIQLLWNH